MTILYACVSITSSKYANKINFLSYFTEFLRNYRKLKVRMIVIKLMDSVQSYKFFNFLSHGFPNISIFRFSLLKCKLNLYTVLLVCCINIQSNQFSACIHLFIFIYLTDTFIVYLLHTIYCCKSLSSIALPQSTYNKNL